MKIHSADSVSPAAMGHGEGVSIRWVISAEHGAPNFAMRVIEVQPGSATPFHNHEEEHEVYVLEGRGTVRGESGETPISAGDVAFVAPSEQHQFGNTGGGPLKLICVIPIKTAQ